MGLFGGKDDTRSKIEELKAKMHGGGQAPPQQGWQPPGQPAPQQGWQPPAQAPAPSYSQNGQSFNLPQADSYGGDLEMEEVTSGIVLDLGDGMSLNLPVKSRMRLDEFLRIADRVRELKKIEHQQHY